MLLVDQKTWSRELNGLVEAKDVSLIPWTLKLDYKNWNYCELCFSFSQLETKGALLRSVIHC